MVLPSYYQWILLPSVKHYKAGKFSALCLHIPEVVERSSVEYPNILFSGTCSTKIMCKVSHVQHKGQQRSTCLTVDAEVTLCVTHGQLYSDLRRCNLDIEMC